MGRMGWMDGMGWMGWDGWLSLVIGTLRAPSVPKRDGFQRNGNLKSSWQSSWHYSSSLARKHYWIEKAVASSCSSLDQSTKPSSRLPQFEQEAEAFNRSDARNPRQESRKHNKVQLKSQPNCSPAHKSLFVITAGGEES